MFLVGFWVGFWLGFWLISGGRTQFIFALATLVYPGVCHAIASRPVYSQPVWLIFPRVCSCFPESSLFGPGIACSSLVCLGSSLFQDRSGLYLSQTTQVSLGVCLDSGQARFVVWAFARRSSLFQGGSSLRSRRHHRFIHGVPCVRAASCLFPDSLAYFPRGCNCFPESPLF